MVWSVSCGVLLCCASGVSADTQHEPSFMHGAGQVVGGILLELPKTVVHATMTEPPIVGTLVGLLGGTARALQVTVGGFVEMASAFDPWGNKKRP